jgi:murein DD-endopeptidase MepM/ murein hydrolase activator NlpD
MTPEIRAAETATVDPNPLSVPRPTLTESTRRVAPADDPVERPTGYLERLTPAPMTSAGVQPCSPLAGHSFLELPEIVSASYDPPPPGKEERHHGVDFSYYRRGERLSIQGLGVQAVLPGKVAMALSDSFPYGSVVLVETPFELVPGDILEKMGMGPGESLYSLYAHFDQPPLVTLGETIEACQVLGYVGNSGNAGVPHLHLETRLGLEGNNFAGMAYYSTQATPEERSNYERWRTSGDFRHFDPMLIFLIDEIILPPTDEVQSSN